jgi:PadR family transcriptional regulator, regulatory protein PadR
MTGAPTVGQFEQYVLTAVLSLRDHAYGVTIHQRVAEIVGPRAVSLGAVYATLDRLEDKGFVASWMSDPTPERGGRAKRHYRVEAPGERALHESAVAAKRVVDSLESLWGGDVWRSDRRWKPARPR